MRFSSLFVCFLLSLPLRAQVPEPTTAPEAEITAPVAGARLVIHKKERLLLLYSEDRELRRYSIGLGFNPTDDKHRQGDGATPEGDYFVCVKNPQSRYYLSLGLSYPNSRDARRALDEGQITAEEQQAIERAQQRGICPPWETSLGGEIYIHGRGSGSDWTLGCVALDDPDMKELFAAISVGTEVTIKP